MGLEVDCNRILPLRGWLAVLSMICAGASFVCNVMVKYRCIGIFRPDKFKV